MISTELLLVDDEANIRLTLSAILEQNNFQVTTAASVADALDLIGKNRYAVLLSDLNIGEPGDGFTVVSAMRRLQPQAATFILTGYPDFESALLAIRSQVDDYFTKPADIRNMVETINRRLNGEKSVPRAPRVRRVSDLLRDEIQPIRDRWLEAVGKNEGLAQVRLTDTERQDHIPAILRELIQRVERESESPTPAGVSAAERYGRERCRQGYTTAQLVLESRLLARTVTSTVQTHLLGVDLSRLIPDLVEVGEGVASLLEISVRAFEAECGKKPA